jgi:hypothetical protein
MRLPRGRAFRSRDPPRIHAGGLGSTVPRITEIGTDWRVIDGVATAWFDAPTLIEGGALAGRIVELSAEIVVDLRRTGMRVRVDSDAHAEGSRRPRGIPGLPRTLRCCST